MGRFEIFYIFSRNEFCREMYSYSTTDVQTTSVLYCLNETNQRQIKEEQIKTPILLFSGPSFIFELFIIKDKEDERFEQSKPSEPFTSSSQSFRRREKDETRRGVVVGEW